MPPGIDPLHMVERPKSKRPVKVRQADVCPMSYQDMCPMSYRRVRLVLLRRAGAEIEAVSYRATPRTQVA